jgi:putative chitinase
VNRLQEFQKRYGLKPDGYIGPITLRAMKREFGILNDARVSHFVGQIVHETANFQYEVENLNYSANGLRKVFSKYFKTYAQALAYEYRPTKIANRVYANRMGNGDEASGDGYLYRGRGPLMLTGKNNVKEFAKQMQCYEIIDNPDLIVSDFYFESALFFFNQNNLWSLCDAVDYPSIVKVSERINGGHNGLKERVFLTERFYKMLK